MDMVTRRGVFSTLGGAAACTMLAAPVAAFDTQQLSPAMAAAMHRHRQAKARAARFSDQTLDPAVVAARVEIEAIPHEQVATAFIDMAGETVRLGTADQARVAMARRSVANPRRMAASEKPWVRALGELAILADARDAKVDAIRLKHRIGSLNEHRDRLDAREYGALVAVIETPAAHMRDLLAKVLLAQREDEVTDETVEMIADDIRRLGDAA